MTVLCFALLNAGFFFLSWWFDLARPVFNIDYVFALLLMSLGWRWAAIGAASVFLLCDILVLLSQVFPFPRLIDLLYLLSLVPYSSISLKLWVAAVTVMLIVKIIAIRLMAGWVGFKSTLLLLNILLMILIYLVYVAGEREALTYIKAGDGLLSSQALTFTSMRSHRFLDGYVGGAPDLQSRPPGASELWFDELSGGQLSSQLLLIIVESWGVPSNPSVQQELMKPLYSVSVDYREEGVLKVSGNTLDGELRELCQLRSSRYNLADVKAGFEGCLPNLLKGLGYATAAIHGATGMMYDRHLWYSRAGFQEQTFYESRIWPRRCFSFPGACDQDVADEVIHYFNTEGAKFVYWLTLNSHSPYDSKDIRTPVFFDCEKYGIDARLESCRNLQLQSQFFMDLSRLLGSEALAGVDVIIVGDHAPVIMNLEERRAQFIGDKVPWVRLKTAAPTPPLQASEQKDR